MKPGDFIVAGTNFGCGSSTPAHYSIVALGIPAVLAESFAPLFFSNCAGGALWPVVCPGILELVETGDTIEVDTDSFVIRNLGTGKTLQGTALPEIYRVPLVLVHMAGFHVKEVAHMSGVPLGTMLARLHRGRKLFERELWAYAERNGLLRAGARA